MNREQSVVLYELYRSMLDESFDDEAVTTFVKHSRIVTKDKGDIIFSPNAESFSTYFILDGVMKTFVLSPDGTENTLGFFFRPGTGFAMNQETVDAAGIWCKTLTPSTLVELSPDIFTLADEFPPLWKNLVLGWRPFYFGMMDKLRAGYTLTAKERYLWFVDRFGPVVDKISLNEIALYLGIQPQSLSRIRNELAEGGAQL